MTLGHDRFVSCINSDLSQGSGHTKIDSMRSGTLLHMWVPNARHVCLRRFAPSASNVYCNGTNLSTPFNSTGPSEKRDKRSRHINSAEPVITTALYDEKKPKKYSLMEQYKASLPCKASTQKFSLISRLQSRLWLFGLWLDNYNSRPAWCGVA